MRRSDERNVPAEPTEDSSLHVEDGPDGPSAEDVFADFVKNANAISQLGRTVRIPLSDIAPKLVESTQPDRADQPDRGDRSESGPISRIEALKPNRHRDAEPGSELEFVDETPHAPPSADLLALLIEEELAEDDDPEVIEAIPLTRYKSSRPPPFLGPPAGRTLPPIGFTPIPSLRTLFGSEPAKEAASAESDDYSQASLSPTSLEASASPWAMLALAPPFPNGVPEPEKEDDVEELDPGLLVDDDDAAQDNADQSGVALRSPVRFPGELGEPSTDDERLDAPLELSNEERPTAERLTEERMTREDLLPPALQFPEGHLFAETEVEPVPTELELPVEHAPEQAEAEDQDFEELDERDIVPDVASLAPPPPPLPEVGEDGQIPAGELDRFLRDMAVLRRYGHRAQVHRGFEEILRRYPEDLLLLRRVVEFHVEEDEKGAAIELLFSLAGRLFERRNVKGMRGALEQVLVLDAGNKRATKLIALLGVRPDTQPGV